MSKAIELSEEQQKLLDEIKKNNKSYKQVIKAIRSIDNITPSYYGAKCKCGAKIDAYTICDLYSKPHKNSAWHHATKKLLRCGDGHKDLLKDINEVIDSLNRWKEQLECEKVVILNHFKG